MSTFVGFATLLSATTFAADDSEWIGCQNPDRLGIANQCGSIHIIQSAASRVRAYSHSQKRHMSFSDQNVFQVRAMDPSDTVEEGKIVLIPGSLVWSQANDDVQMLCRVYDKSIDDVISLECGQSNTLKIQREDALIPTQTYQDYTRAEEAKRLRKLNAAAQP